MVDFAKLNDNRRRWKAFTETDLGKSYLEYERTIIAYWREDGNDRISDRRLIELSDKQRKAELNFRNKLMEVAGV